MIFACTALVSCSNEKDPPSNGINFYANVRLLEVDTLSVNEAFTPDATTVKLTMQGTTLMLDIDCVQIYRNFPFRVGGDFIVWVTNNGALDIYLVGENGYENASESAADSRYVSIKGCIDNIPEWMSHDKPSMSTHISYLPNYTTGESFYFTYNWKFDIRDGQSKTWEIPALSFENAAKTE